MNAMAAVQPPPDDAPSPTWHAMRPSSLAAAAAERHPERLALIDQPGRQDWSGRPRIAWTHATAGAIRRRLVRFLAGLGLPSGAVVGLCLPGGSEASLALLAVEEAGLTPCLLPLSWSEEELGTALEAAHVQAVVTQGAVGDCRPAKTLCRLAARYFGLRFVCAFGPHVPDGVIDIDRFIVGEDGPEAAPAEAPREGGIVTFSRRDGPGRPVFRPLRSALAATLALLVATRIEPGDRLVTLVAPDDLAGLATGPLAALVSGAALESHGLFDGARLIETLTDPACGPTHVVAPGWMETHLAAAGLPPCVRSVLLVHPAPVRFRAKTALARPVVDVLALDEDALVAQARRGDRFALSLQDEAGGTAPAHGLLRVRTGPGGEIEVAGAAGDVRSFGRSGPDSAAGREWRATGRRAEVFAGIVIGVS